MKKWILNTIRGFEAIAFPQVCISCGMFMPDKNQLICSNCVANRFEDPNPANENACEKMILPNGVLFQDALWKYDKEGIVQEMIRLLKYQGMGKIGIELGEAAGRKFIRRHPGKRIHVSVDQMLLLPVPLHPKREKKRGYNQAKKIAEGISQVSGIQIAPDSSLVRIKFTTTQTRFSLKKRMENLKGVFSVADPEVFKNKVVIIIDDVFTTGSTCFSIAEILNQAEPRSIGIFTVAMP